MDEFDQTKATEESSEVILSDLIKSQIANHPAYPHLLSAYIECQKVGAPPETASLLEEISRENHALLGLGGCRSSQIGDDQELDDFMESYCEILQRFKEELAKPFNEATTFLSNIESQLSNLCEGTFTKTLDCDHIPEEDQMSSNGDQVDIINDEDQGDINYINNEEENYGLTKEKLMNKYSGYLSMLKTEFLKKRKKVELPIPARTTLLQWWNANHNWPYPTEEEKLKLSEETGLDQKQINNWFVNQRKRHWKPSEEIKNRLSSTD